MRLNGRIMAATLTGVLVAAGSVGGYLLSAGSAKADNASVCIASPASGGICSISAVVLPPTQTVYLQFAPNLAKNVTQHSQVTYSAVCDGQTIDSTAVAAPPNIVNINQSYAKSCTVTANLQVSFQGPAATTPNSVTMELNYVTPGAAPAPSTPSGGHSGGGTGITGAIKGPGGKCADDAGNSSKLRAKVDIWSCNHGAAQKWTYSAGEVKHGSLCLNAKSNGQVILWSCNGQPNEIWIFNTINHEVLLKAHGFTQCLTDPRGSTKNGTQLTWSSCKNNASQHWSLPGH